MYFKADYGDVLKAIVFGASSLSAFCFAIIALIRLVKQ